MSSTVTVVDGDLLDQDVEAIVNPWNRNLLPWWILVPSGVSGAIRKRAGTAPFRELSAKGPLLLGYAVDTGAGRLPYRGIVHVCTLNVFWLSSEHAVRSSARHAMYVAQYRRYKSIAFPLLGAGTGGISPEKSLAWITDEIRKHEYETDVVVVRHKRKPRT